MLVPPFHPSPDWAESLAENLLMPNFSISIWEAFGRRLRRNYLWIFIILYLAWVAKIWLYPIHAISVAQFLERAAVGPLSGEAMIVLGLIFYAGLFTIALATVTMTRASGEVLPKFGDEAATALLSTKEGAKGLRGWFAPRNRRKQLLALIITSKAEAVSDRILADLKRGVTALSGKGMYTGTDRSVLMCALTVTEVNNLKTTVVKEDKQAFVIVSPAQEILGRGFHPLDEEEESR